MTIAQIKKILGIVEDLEITDYSFLDDIQTRYYNNEYNARLFLDETNEMLWNIRKTLATESYANANPIAIIGNDITDIRRFQVFGNAAQITAFAEALGLTLDETDKKVIVKLDRTNKEVMSLTGDYNNIFHVVSKETYDAMTEEEKQEYDKHMEIENKRFDLPAGSAAQITV